MKRNLGFVSLLLAAVLVARAPAPAAAPAEGQLTWAVAVALAPSWFDPAPATGAAWIIPSKYVERVGDDGFRKAPVGAGPYRFVSFTPGVELVLEAHEQFWRKSPTVKRLVLKAVPDEVTRVAMLKRGEVDVAYALRGAIAEDVRRTPGLGLKPAHSFGGHWVLFTEQWDPKSLWADRRVRLAVNHAIDRQAVNQSITLGFSRMTGSIIPMDFEFYWPAPLYSYDSKKAKQLLTEAGYPNGFDAGELATDANFADYTEAVANYLGAVGIRTRVRPLERAAYFTQVREKKLRPLVYLASGAYGNAATRLDSLVAA